MESVGRWLARVNTVLYGDRMSDRLAAGDWVKAGLKALAADGVGALKADLLAKSLGISRGSFYWHFADIGAFHAAVLTRWREKETEAVIQDLEGVVPRGDRLRSLLRRAFTADARLEIAVRAWAVSDPEARAAVAAVDRRRLAYLEDILAAAGVDTASAFARARILYWAYLGFALSRPKLARRHLERLLAEFAALAEAR
jgi:AcrR family transcriptional regulator